MIKYILAFGCFIIIPYISYSETKLIQTSGYVHSTEVLKKLITRQVPTRKKICEIKRFPANNSAQEFGADNLIGALIGGAIGNQLGKGGGKSGSTAIGALIGSEVVRKDKSAHAQSDNFVEKEICRLERIVNTETFEQISGYRLTVEVDGELITLSSNRSYNPGELISITKKIKYSIN